MVFGGGEPDDQNDITVLRVADFDRQSFKVSDLKLTTRSIPPKDRGSRLLKQGDLLIEKSGGGDKTLVGCVVLFDKAYEAVTSNFVAKMSPLESYDSYFLAYAFSQLYAGKVNYPSIKQTTGIQNLDSDSYLMEKFCFPPKHEQKNISCFLDHETAKIDNLIEKQQQLIKLLKEKRQAVISHAVTKGLNPDVPMKDSGVEWLGKVPEHWGVTRAKFISKIFVPQRNKPELNDDTGIFWVTMENMNQHYITFSYQHVSDSAALKSGSKVLPKGAVIASCVGNFGVAAINEVDVIINQQLQAFQPVGVTADFLMALVSISKNYFELIGTAATLIYVNKEGFENLPVLVPPECEQVNICKFIKNNNEKFELLIEYSINQINLLQERRTALISAAVTGKIDVRDWVAPNACEAEVSQEATA